MGSSSEEKNLPPSAKKLRDARKKGQIPKSKDLVSAVATLAGLGYIMMQAGPVAGRFASLIAGGGDLDTVPLSRALPPLVERIATASAATLAPLFLLLVIAAMLASLLVTGGPVLSLDPLTPKLDRLNPAEGIKKLFSLRSLFELIKSLLKLVIVVLVAVSAIRSSLQAMVELPACGLACSGGLLRANLLLIAGPSVLVFLAIGVADMALQRWLFTRDQRMSLTEKKNEQKNTNGNPLILGAHKSERRDAANAKIGLWQATFLLTGSRLVVAMRYSVKDTRVPVAVARADRDDVAPLLQKARLLKLPVLYDPDTARAVYERVALGRTIPRDLFQPVLIAMRRLGVV